MGTKSLKNILYRIYGFFFALLALSLSSVIFLTSDDTLHKNIGVEIPNIEIHGFTLYTINPQQTQTITDGYKALRFSDHEELFDVLVNQLNKDNLHEYLSSSFVISKDRIYTFPQGVDYLRLDGLSFWSQKGIYEYQKHIFSGKGNFILRNTNTNASGLNIYYNGTQEIIQADSMKADISLQKNKTTNTKQSPQMEQNNG